MSALAGQLTLPQCDGVEVSPGMFLIGEPSLREDGELVCLANVHGALVVVSLRVRLKPEAIPEEPPA